MTQYLPTLRGWIGLLIPIIACVSYATMLPPYFHESGVKTWISSPVPLLTWALGGCGLLTCFGVCIEAFRRGSRADKVAVGIGLLFCVSLLTEYLLPLMVPVRPSRNEVMHRMSGSQVAVEFGHRSSPLISHLLRWASRIGPL